MKLTDVVVDKRTLGNQFKLVSVKPNYVYTEGKRTQTVGGYTYTVVLPEKSFERVDIKIDGILQLDVDKEPLDVIFEGLSLYIYWVNGNYQLGAKALGIKSLKQ